VTRRHAAAALAAGALVSLALLTLPAAGTGVTVAPEDPGDYLRAQWGNWSVVGGCDTRERVLIAQGTGVVTGPGCRVLAGTWTSPYDGVMVTDPSALDIDHIVPLAEAARSGARSWTAPQRSAYYNDVADLVAVTARTNRSKGDRDAARWLPQDSYRCAYAHAWVTVKTAYRLTEDQAEHAALAQILDGCP
jgi:hypothetical protein